MEQGNGAREETNNRDHIRSDIGRLCRVEQCDSVGARLPSVGSLRWWLGWLRMGGEEMDARMMTVKGIVQVQVQSSPVYE